MDADAGAVVPMRRDFRFVHEPIALGDMSVPSLGHHTLRAGLLERLRYSSGGALLLGGFRGAGKTTLVRQVTDELAQDSSERTWVVVHLDVAHPVGTQDLLYTIVRRMYEALDDRGLLSRLNADVRESIGLAYLRTTASVATKRSESRERNTTLGLSGALGATLGGLAPKLEHATKRTDSLATDIAFLTYAESDVEHDFLRIVGTLSRSRLRPSSWWARVRGRRESPVHVLVVLDELDKLTNDEAGTRCLDDVLTVLKNVLATGGVHFVFVAGTDLLDRALTDSELGNGLFESVFAWNAYVPCLWNASRLLLDGVIDESYQDATHELRGYLDYKARGIPRRLFQELNGFVRWLDGSPCLELSGGDVRRVRFYARLGDVLDSYIGTSSFEVDSERNTVDYDRFRLSSYYVLDWTLRTEGGVFGADELLNGPRALSRLFGLTNRRVTGQLEYLADNGLLERLTDPTSPFQTFIGDAPSAGAARYRLAVQVRLDLNDITRDNPRERADLLGVAGGAPESPSRGGADSEPWANGRTPSGPGYRPDWAPDRGGAPFPGGAPGSSGWTPPGGWAPDRSAEEGEVPPNGGRPRPAPPAPAPASVPPASRPPSSARIAASPFEAPSTPLASVAVPNGEPVAGRRADWAVPRGEQYMGAGRFRLLDVVGAGGTGTVYRAHDSATDRDVAIKVLAAAALNDETLRARFVREQKIATQVHLEGVVETIAVLDEPDGRLGIVMELLDGTPLNSYVADALAPADAVTLTATLLATIGRLHALGLVRLDIKPANIMIDRSGRPVILDLGLARPVLDEGDAVTIETVILGTPAFMAPEQVQGALVDNRADLYSVGCVLYQRLGGDLAPELDLMQLIYRKVREPFLPTDDVDCSPELRQVLRRLTAREPADRYPTAELARDALLLVPEARR